MKNFLLPMAKKCALCLMLIVVCSVLEMRAATYTVTNTNDAGAGSLRQAINDANATPADDTIVFNSLGCANNTCFIYLTNGELVIQASGGRLTVDNQTSQTIALFGYSSRLFYINGFLTVNNLNLQNGKGIGTFDPSVNRRGGAVYVNNGEFNLTNSVVSGSSTPNNTVDFSEAGGGIYANSGSVTIRDSEISGNQSNMGGGIYNYAADVTVFRSLIFDNRTVTNANNGAGTGAGIWNQGGTLYLVNTTIAKNSAQNSYGALLAGSGPNSVFITNCTIVENTANSFPGVYSGVSFTVRMRNTVIAGNSAPLNNYDYGYTSYISGGKNILGTSFALQEGDIIGVTDTGLGAIGYNGGRTRTYLPRANSILVNAGNNCVRTFCTDYAEPFSFSDDQRGVSRINNGNVDIGAVERISLSIANNSTLTSGRKNEAYGEVLFASGGTAPYTFTVTGGALPNGLTLSPGGFLSGTPTVTGTFNFTVQVSDSSTTSGLFEKGKTFDLFAPQAIAATKDFQLQILAPTAAGVFLGGRVIVNGRGAANARVTMTDQNGDQRFARTNSFGFFRFGDVPAGETYIISVSHKLYRFAPQSVSLTEDLNGIIFNAGK